MNRPDENIILFPAFTRFLRESRLDEKAKGNLAASIPRILGQGKTRAENLDLPPAAIERKIELVNLRIPDEFVLPEEAIQEVAAINDEVKQLKKDLASEDGIRRVAVTAIQHLSSSGITAGQKDTNFFANSLILKHANRGMEWSWCVTPYYPLIRKIPPDPDYIVKAFYSSKEQVEKLAVPEEDFENKLILAWTLARQISGNEDVLVTDVMRMFKIAGQDDRFWQSPKKQLFKDVPEAAFVINLIRWRNRRPGTATGFEFVQATLNQAHGSKASVFYLPMNQEGTDVRPIIYMRRR